jgi:dihydropteroate synthase
MGVLNVTPDSFSDGNQFSSIDQAVAHAQHMESEGADIIDVGGESTRPGSGIVSPEEEIRRVVPVIEEIRKRSDIPISIDTTKSLVARAALNAGANIVNDISALRFDFHIADEAAKLGAGLILMHSRGTPVTMHKLPPVADILDEVKRSLKASIAMAEKRGVKSHSIVIDPGIGFGKSQEQNLELIAKLEELAAAFPKFPLLVGTSRKSFLGRVLADENGEPRPVTERTAATLTTNVLAVLHGAAIVRVHDVRETRDALSVIEAVKTVRT